MLLSKISEDFKKRFLMIKVGVTSDLYLVGANSDALSAMEVIPKASWNERAIP